MTQHRRYTTADEDAIAAELGPRLAPGAQLPPRCDSPPPPLERRLTAKLEHTVAELDELQAAVAEVTRNHHGDMSDIESLDDLDRRFNQTLEEWDAARTENARLRGELADLTGYVRGTADSAARRRARQRLDHVAEAEALAKLVGGGP